jgi:iron complex transport system substrate-binding protein
MPTMALFAATVMTRFLIVACLAGFALTAHADITVLDDAGSEVRLPAPAKRIITLAPHITEELFAAGAGDRVVATVDYSDYPEAAKKLPRIGSYNRFDMEAIFALKPDLIIAWQSGNPTAHVERLKALGLPVYLSQPNRIEDVAIDLERFGILAGTKTSADAAARNFRERLADLRSRFGSRPRVRTFYQVWNQPIMTVSGRQIISDVISLCGGDNVFAGLSGMAPTVSEEAVLAAAPEAIIASGMDDARPEWVDHWRRWPQMTAVVRNNLFFIPPNLIQRHTPRLLDGAEQLCRDLETARQRRPTER